MGTLQKIAGSSLGHLLPCQRHLTWQQPSPRHCIEWSLELNQGLHQQRTQGVASRVEVENHLLTNLKKANVG
jgi:hypothetical protein